MTADSDEEWLRALRGDAAASSSASPAALEAGLIRRALRDAAAAPVDPALAPDVEAIVRRARAARGTGCAWCDELQRRLGRWFGGGTVTWVAASVALAAGVLVWQQATAPGDEPVLRAGSDIRTVARPDPRASRDRLADLLELDGARVRRYERLGRFGLDVDSLPALSPATAQALAADGAAVAAGAPLRIEFERQE